jgi:hypothetical protein
MDDLRVHSGIVTGQQLDIAMLQGAYALSLLNRELAGKLA